MKRFVNLEEMTDGRLYDGNDMVKADCHGCNGCSSCCREMGDSIVLDPFDAYNLSKGTGKNLSEMLYKEIGLSVKDGIILPHINMEKDANSCGFLDENGRCRIHSYRPGICRLFPLGRLYEGDGFKYINQIKECLYPGKTKIKIKKWIGIQDLSAYESFVMKWHVFCTEASQKIKSLSDEMQKKYCIEILKRFYLTPYDEDSDFYIQYEERVKEFLSDE